MLVPYSWLMRFRQIVLGLLPRLAVHDAVLVEALCDVTGNEMFKALFQLPSDSSLPIRCNSGS